MKCKASWCSNEVYASGVCRPHTNHLYRYGELRRFSHLPNEVIKVGKHYEIVLYNRDMSESGLRVKIDKKTLNLIQGKRFYYRVSDLKKPHLGGYARESKPYGEYLHQIISKCDKPLVCDHINRNKLDCRVENLRCVDRSTNNLNK